MIFKNAGEFDALVAAFENQSLPKKEWTHEAHLAVALHFVRNYSRDDVAGAIRKAIILLNNFHGTPNTGNSGYHETLTVFWLSVISAFVRRNRDIADSFGLANQLLEGGFDSKLPLRHYTRERLFSPDARRRFIAPDIEEFEILVRANR